MTKGIKEIKVYQDKAAVQANKVRLDYKAFKESTLLGEFELGPSPWWNFMTDSDQYSRQRLGGDLEKLRSFYLDRGYLKFVVESTQVTITPDRKDIYITINVNASDNVGVTRTTCAVDGQVLGISSSATLKCTWNIKKVAAGIHNISATAEDAAGNKSTTSIQVTK